MQNGNIFYVKMFHAFFKILRARFRFIFFLPSNPFTNNKDNGERIKERKKGPPEKVIAGCFFFHLNSTVYLSAHIYIFSIFWPRWIQKSNTTANCHRKWRHLWPLPSNKSKKTHHCFHFFDSFRRFIFLAFLKFNGYIIYIYIGICFVDEILTIENIANKSIFHISFIIYLSCVSQ